MQRLVPTSGDPGVVAVSGGPDSIALLHALTMLPLGPIVVAHVNHRLRGDESDGDEQFVREVVERLQRPDVRFRTVKLETLCETGNLEDRARTLRLGFLQQCASECGASWIATGHTADDHAETILFRLLRGTGLSGLRGIPESRELSAQRLIRPLLSLRRTDVLNYLNEHRLPYSTDTSNADHRYSRNRIRHELLPLLHEYQPNVVEHLAHLAQQASEWEDDHEASASRLLNEVEQPRSDHGPVLDRRPLIILPRHRVRELLRVLWVREKWPLADMGFREWERAASVVFGEITAVDLPGRIRVRRRGTTILVSRHESPIHPDRDE